MDLRSLAHTFECVNYAIAHNMPQLSITNLWCNNQMLFRWCHHNGADQTSARHSHRSNLAERKENDMKTTSSADALVLRD